MNEILELQCGVGAGDALPVGQYDLEIVGIEQAPTHEKFGDGIRWCFKVIGGEHDGKTTQKIGPTRPTPKNWSGRIIAAALNRPVGDENISVKDLIGKIIVGIVGPDKDGKPSLCMFFAKSKQ